MSTESTLYPLAEGVADTREPNAGAGLRGVYPPYPPSIEFEAFMRESDQRELCTAGACISIFNKRGGGYVDTWIRATPGERGARAWLEIFGGAPRTSTCGAPWVSTVQRLMLRHTGLDISEATFIRAARDAGFPVNTHEHSGRPPRIGIGRAAVAAVEHICERRTRAGAGYWHGRLLAALSELPIPDNLNSNGQRIINRSPATNGIEPASETV